MMFVMVGISYLSTNCNNTVLRSCGTKLLHRAVNRWAYLHSGQSPW